MMPKQLICEVVCIEQSLGLLRNIRVVHMSKIGFFVRCRAMFQNSGVRRIFSSSTRCDVTLEAEQPHMHSFSSVHGLFMQMFV